MATKTSSDIAKRVEKLRSELNHHNHLYYIEAKPSISDRDYDRLMQELIVLENAHPELRTADSPTQRVGGDVQDALKPVRHAVPMMSIDNTYSEDEVRAFDERVRKGLGGRQPAYVLEPKIDGASVSLRYEDGKLVLAATRGRGNVGDDITANARTIKSIPLTLRKDGAKVEPPEVLEVRGEVYMDNDDFQRVNKELADEGEETYANPRNLTAGTLRRLDPKIVAKRPKLPYMTDGMVMKVDRFDQRDKLGATSKAPRWVIAYKYETEQQPTVIKDCRWQVGKGGSLTPVGDLEPVFIGGVTVTHVSLHNIDQIHRLDVHLCDTVVIERAGEVIPYVVEVVKDKRPAGAKRIEAPTKCPECGTEVEREALPEDTVAYRCVNTECDAFFERKKCKRVKCPEACPVCAQKVEILDAGIELYCPNPACPAQVKERLRWFCHRGQMDIEGVGDKLVEQLVDRGMVKTFADLYRLKEEDIANLGSEVVQEGKTVKRTVGEKVAAKVVANIASSRERGLDRLLAGLGIHHVGNRVAYVLAQNFGSLDALSAASKEELAAVHEIGDVIAESVHDFFHNPAGKQTVAGLKKAGVDPTMKVVKKPAELGLFAEPSADQPLAGKTVVVTGTMEKYDRKQMEELILKLGGKASGSVSKKTSFVVAGENAGSKLDKAKELGVEVIDEQTFCKRFKQFLPT